MSIKSSYYQVMIWSLHAVPHLKETCASLLCCKFQRVVKVCSLGIWIASAAAAASGNGVRLEYFPLVNAELRPFIFPEHTAADNMTSSLSLSLSGLADSRDRHRGGFGGGRGAGRRRAGPSRAVFRRPAEAELGGGVNPGDFTSNSSVRYPHTQTQP